MKKSFAHWDYNALKVVGTIEFDTDNKGHAYYPSSVPGPNGHQPGVIVVIDGDVPGRRCILMHVTRFEIAMGIREEIKAPKESAIERVYAAKDREEKDKNG